MTSDDNHMKVGEYNPGFTINVIRFSNDGNYLAIGGVSPNIVVINGFEPFNLNKTFPHSLGSSLYGLDFSSDSTKFLACGATTAIPIVGKVWLYAVTATGTAWANLTAAPISPVPNPATTSLVPNDCRISPFDGKIGVALLATIFIYSDTLDSSALYFYSPSNTNFSKIAFDPLGTYLLYHDRTGFELF
jgi:hypothetical protein